MARADRAKLIQDIESARNSKLLVYVTGDRRGFEAQIAFDVLSLLHDHLERIGKAGDLDVFLYSTGGLTIAGWRIAGLLREFCEGKLSFLIPYKAQSTATLMVLGADEIMMGPMGQLSPIDPSLTSPYSPRDPASGQPLPISVEDVAGYFEMARDMAKLSGSTELQAVFSKLTDAVSPLALGGVLPRASADTRPGGEAVIASR